MLRWAFTFLVVGLIAGLLGFTSIAGASIGIAKFLFFLFVAMFIVFLILGLTVSIAASQVGDERALCLAAEALRGFCIDRIQRMALSGPPPP